MDIDLLSKMVKELILDNDRVVLPGLGCFVAEIVPSVFSDRGYTINPPYRKLSFRARPDQGDELARFYAGTNNVGYDAAEHIINNFVAELRTVLHQKKTVVFPGLGRLRATKENTVFFVADENLDIYPAGFGLEPISLKTHQQTREEVSAAVEGLRSIIDDCTAGVQPDDGPVETAAAVEPESSAEAVESVGSEDSAEAVESVGPELLAEEPGLTESGCYELAGAVTGAAATVGPESEDKGKPVWRILLWTIAGIAALLLMAMAVYMALAIYAPEFLDSLLYTPEELEILNHQG